MKNYLLLISIICLPAFVQAQNEFSLYAGAGQSSMNYKLLNGDRSNGFGGDFGAGYTHFFNENFGINTGLGLAFYSAKTKINNETTLISSNLKDNEGDDFDMHSTLKNFEEKQNAMFLNIPVMLQFQTGKINKFYLQGGAKIGIPISGNYETTDATITNKAYYPKYDNWATTQKFMGFGVFQNQKSEGDLGLNVSLMLSAETGMKWNLSNKLRLYTGLFFDYGLNDIINKHDKPFINYNLANPENISTNSVLESLSNTETMTNKVSIVAIGFKLKIALER